MQGPLLIWCSLNYLTYARFTLSIQEVLIKQFFSAKYSMGAADTEVGKTDKYSAFIRLTGNLKRWKYKVYMFFLILF